MNKRIGSAGGLLAIAIAVAAVYAFLPRTPDDVATGPIPSKQAAAPGKGDVTGMIESLPPTAAGAPSSSQLPPSPAPAAKAPETGAQRADLAGTSAKGRVERVYVRVAEGVLLDLAKAMPHQRDGWRYVDLEFPDPLANGALAARALVPEAGTNPGLGDVVEMRFAHRKTDQFFPVRERDKVIALVAKADSTLAQDFQRRILARSGGDSPTGMSSAIAGPGMRPGALGEALTGGVSSAASKTQ